MTTALITGIAGQDGAYLSTLLRAKGCRVVGMTRPGAEVPARLRPFLQGVELVEGDLRDGDSLRSVIAGCEPDEVYNLAGLSSVAASWQQPELTSDVNGIGVLRLVLALVEHADSTGRSPRLLQASSAEIFGHAESWPQDEATPLRPRNPYAVAKAYAHQVIATYRSSSGLRASTVILYNHESPLRPTAFVSRKISRTVAEIALGRSERLVLGDLDARRDWGHAADYVRAMWMALQQDDPSDYVVATGEVHSVREFAEQAFAVVGISGWQRYVTSSDEFVRPTDSRVLVGDAGRARRVLGWAPDLTFDDLIEEMVRADLEALSSDAPGNAASG